MPSDPPVAIYHLHVKNISRGDGRSAVAAAAYRAGETLPNDAEEKDSAFGGKRDVLFTDILLPAGAPAWMSDRARLWNAAEAAEKRKDARLAKEIEFALPLELPPEAWLPAAHAMAEAYVRRGHVVDLAVHDDGTSRNPHIHLLLATRSVTADGFGLKLREADGLAFVTDARKTWETIANAALGKAGADVQIDARSHAARGIDQAPTKHRGPDPAERRARRWRKPMDHDLLEARRELLSEGDVRRRFPALASRSDWPSERREAVPGLSLGEALEWQTFWREVDKRLWGPELHPAPEPAEQVWLESRQPAQVGELTRKLTEQVARDAARREATVEDAFPIWKELHAAMLERIRADGHRTDDPVYDWKRIEASMREFNDRLTELRLREIEQRALLPVPDRDGRPISREEHEAAEERLLADGAKAPSQMAATRTPERGPAAERAEALAAVERQNRIEVPEQAAYDYRLAPHEGRLDWLGTQADETVSFQQTLEDRLDWLLPEKREKDRDMPDHERER